MFEYPNHAAAGERAQHRSRLPLVAALLDNLQNDGVSVALAKRDQ
jgi:hypothetical protein